MAVYKSKSDPILRIHTLCLAIALFLSLCISSPALAQSSSNIAMGNNPIVDFDLLDQQVGWIWLNDRLYWSTDNGQSWLDITPQTPDDLHLSAVHFPNPNLGYAILGKPNNGNWQALWLAKTNDPKAGWSIQEITLPDNELWKPIVEKYQINFLDADHGWLMVKYVSSANFNLGSFYLTRDGGKNWLKSSLDMAGEIYFSDPDLGWLTVEQPRVSMLQTRDGGFSWQPIQNLPIVLYPTPPAQTKLLGDQPYQNILLLAKGKPIEVDPSAHPPVDATRFWEGIDRIDFINNEIGWATYEKGQCNPHGTEKITCHRDLGLLKTTDGGSNWKAISVPGLPYQGLTEDVQSISASEKTFNITGTRTTANLTSLYQGHAFDKCEVPTLAQLQDWINSSPYRGLNLYIGGVLRACSNSALNAEYVNQIRGVQGWSLIPTWVGPQAPCTTFSKKISSNISTAYQQGVNEAASALTTAAALNLALPDQSGTIIYYDMEAYDTTNTSCNNAVKSFINGWVTQMHAKNSLAAIYSTGPVLNQIAAISNLPDAIWPAHWIYSQFNPDATVWDIYRLSNDVWNQHQRVRQYSGGHYETWGSVRLNIDSNVLDGIVLFSWRDYLNFPNQVFLPLIRR